MHKHSIVQHVVVDLLRVTNYNTCKFYFAYSHHRRLYQLVIRPQSIVTQNKHVQTHDISACMFVSCRSNQQQYIEKFPITHFRTEQKYNGGRLCRDVFACDHEKIWQNLPDAADHPQYILRLRWLIHYMISHPATHMEHGGQSESIVSINLNKRIKT